MKNIGKPVTIVLVVLTIRNIAYNVIHGRVNIAPKKTLVVSNNCKSY